MNSIQKEIDAHSLANEIRLHRAKYSGSFLIVEGKNDTHLLKRFHSRGKCQILTAFTRENVVGSIVLLDTDGISGVLGLIDRDYVDLVPEEINSKNVVYTEENDVEMMILCSPALEAVLAEYGSEDKIRSVQRESGKEVRELIFDAYAVIGALRVISKRDGLGLKFAGMSFRFQNDNEIHIDVEAQFRHVLQRSRLPKKLRVKELQNAAEHLVKSVENNKKLCRGHDGAMILAKALRRLVGTDSQFDSKKRVGNLEKILRLAYERVYFKRTNTYLDIKMWEKRSGYEILEAI